MAHWLRFFALVALVVIGGFVFELQNIWSFNEERVLALRMIFGACALMAIGLQAWGRFRFLVPLALAAAFGITSALSRSEFSVPYVLLAMLIVAAAAVLGLPGRRLAPPHP
jgi:hypothetical protein